MWRRRLHIPNRHVSDPGSVPPSAGPCPEAVDTTHVKEDVDVGARTGPPTGQLQQTGAVRRQAATLTADALVDALGRDSPTTWYAAKSWADETSWRVDSPARRLEHPDHRGRFRNGGHGGHIGVIKGLVDRGVRVPLDVSVAGHDDQPFSEMWMPPPTKARQDFNDLGSRAYRLLQESLREEDGVGASVATPELVERDSAGPPGGR